MLYQGPRVDCWPAVWHQLSACWPEPAWSRGSWTQQNHAQSFILPSSVADPDTGAFLVPRSGMGKINPEPDPGWIFLIIFLISENYETIFWVKNSLIRMRDPGSGMEKIRIRDKHDITPSRKLFAGSGKHYSESGQLRIQNKYEVKLLWKMIKFDNFSPKPSTKKTKFPSIKINFAKGSETKSRSEINWKVGSGQPENHSGSTTLPITHLILSGYRQLEETYEWWFWTQNVLLKPICTQIIRWRFTCFSSLIHQ